MLQIKVVRAHQLRNVQTLVPQDPFVQVYFEAAPHVVVKSSVIKLGGRNPRWHNGNVLDLAAPENSLSKLVRVEVFDWEGMRKPRIIGKGEFDLTEFEEDGAEDQPITVELFHEGKSAGQLALSITYEPAVSGGDESPESHHVNESKFESLMQSQTWLTAVQKYLSYLDMRDSVAYKRSIAWLGRQNPSLVVSFTFAYLFVLTTSATVQSIHSWVFTLSWYLLWFVAWYLVLPLTVITCIPKSLGWILTKIVQTLAHGYPISFGLISIVPYMTDLKVLRLRITVRKFFMGNPPRAAFVTNKFMSLERLDLEISCTLAHLWNCLTLRAEPRPLKKIPDYERMITLNVERLEFHGFLLDFQISPVTKRLNINEMTKAFAVGEVHSALKGRNVDLSTFKFPNFLEVKVVRAKDLLPCDRNGLSDPFYVLKVRKEERKSATVVTTLNPVFLEKTETFVVSDPASVLVLEIFDEDVGKKADFIGRWLITTKWLLIDPKHCEYLEWKTLSPEETKAGWISMWVPLMDEKFVVDKKRGSVQLKMRWTYKAEAEDPKMKVELQGEDALPCCFPPLLKSPKSALDQITENRIETRLRLGDVDSVIKMLNHVPVLFHFIGPVIVKDARIFIRDLLFGKGTNSHSVTMASIKRAFKQNPRPAPNAIQDSTKAAEDADDSEIISPSSNSVRTSPLSKMGARFVFPSLTKKKPSQPAQENEDSSDKEKSPLLSSPQRRLAAIVEETASKRGEDDEQKEEISRIPSISNLSKSLGMLRSSFSSPPHETKKPANLKSAHSAPGVVVSVVKSSTDSHDERSDTETPSASSIKVGSPSKAKPQLAASKVQSPQDQVVSKATPPSSTRRLKRKASSSGGVVNGETESSPSPGGIREQSDAGSVASTTKGEDLLGVTSGEEVPDDDEDDDEEFDENGRQFVRVKQIEWHKQFKTRCKGDEGITAFKVLDRFFRGLIPKLAANRKLHVSVMGATLKNFFLEQNFLGTAADKMLMATKSAVTGTVRTIANVATQQKQLVYEKYVTSHDAPHYRHRTQSETLPAYGCGENTTGGADDVVARINSTQRATRRVRPRRKADAYDEDLFSSPVQSEGYLDAKWDGRKLGVMNAMFAAKEKWRPLHVMLRGDTIFFRRNDKDHSELVPWYVLDLKLCTGLILLEDEIHIRFGGGSLTLLFKRSSKPGMDIPLPEWHRLLEDKKRAHQRDFLHGVSLTVEIDDNDSDLEDHTDDSKVRLIRQASSEGDLPADYKTKPEDPLVAGLKGVLPASTSERYDKPVKKGVFTTISRVFGGRSTAADNKLLAQALNPGSEEVRPALDLTSLNLPNQ